MNKLFTVIFLSMFISLPASAEKPKWAGTGKPTAEQKQAHKAAMEEKIDASTENIGERAKKEKPEKSKGLAKLQQKKANKAANKDKIDNEKESVENKTDKVRPEKAKGLAKQQKKSEQVQKELNKGSEKGQESRQNRKKWWNFWGE